MLPVAARGTDVSWDYLKSVLAAAGADGAISIQRTPSSTSAVTQTQPPLLAWAVWENFQAANSMCAHSKCQTE
eukprot:CAMPEP_0175178324 /NCGR_PEP_ID=MMETSP0087-20121206/34899_1 /TAXON_ID=136419 /ORGANISM="Unknown Unknown, Strain D1" /LENGTH=72 /DNA_ID=CAMNT_0016470441 /DNA_START=44 /DNA_END=259 /DNA_ORIENTATION=-